MSMFDNREKDELYEEMAQFLENHSMNELLQIIASINEPLTPCDVCAWGKSKDAACESCYAEANKEE